MDNYNWESVLNFDDCWSPTPVWELPTPPHSQANSPPTHSPEDKNSLVSVSTTFFPAFQHRCRPPDLILLSDDAVHFYVHSDLLLGLSENRFNGMLPFTPVDGNEPPILAISEPSPVLNIILHAIYDMTCAQYSPPFETLVNAVDSMPIYGISPKAIIRPSTPLFTLLLSQAPLFPLESYALAAHHDILDLAVPISSHMLAFPLSSLSDQIVERIGASYLKQLFFLHFGRAEALKRVLLLPPHPHAPTADCDFSSQKVIYQPQPSSRHCAPSLHTYPAGFASRRSTTASTMLLSSGLLSSEQYNNMFHQNTMPPSILAIAIHIAHSNLISVQGLRTALLIHHCSHTHSCTIPDAYIVTPDRLTAHT